MCLATIWAVIGRRILRKDIRFSNRISGREGEICVLVRIK